MDAIVYQHELHEDAGLFDAALRSVGFALTTRFRSASPADATKDLVVVLGGTMAAADTAEHPFLADELAVLRQRLRNNAPCLGLCLGAQLLAKAAGATTHRGNAGTEIGGLPITWTANGYTDPVLQPSKPSCVVAQWHQDSWTDVPGAVHLASSAKYPQQAFRLGASYAFQFHLELDAERFRRWLDLDANGLARIGHDLTALHATIPALAADDDARRHMVLRLAAHFAPRRGDHS